MYKLKVNDQVKVVLGKDKGKTAKITAVLPKRQAVIVEGMNKYKRHIRRRDDKNPGGIIEIERPLNVAKVQLLCPKCKKPTRVGFQIDNAKKVRVCKKCQAKID